MKRLWFRRRCYGWGWTPVTWEGWLVVLGFIALIVWNAFRLDAHSHSASDTIRPFVVETLLMTLVLIGICYATGEKPRWQWGDRAADAKLFLASSADKVLHTLKELIPGVGNKVLFLANAADPYQGNHFWVEWDRKAFAELGYEMTEVDLRKTDKKEFEKLLSETDILHVCGGSISYLWWILKDRGVREAIITAVRSGSVVYTGTSAGSMMVSENLAMFSYDDEEEREYASRGFDKKGLGLVPFTIAPHSDQKDFVESHKKVVEELVTNPAAVVLLHDNQAIFAKGDTFRFVQASEASGR